MQTRGVLKAGARRNFFHEASIEDIMIFIQPCLIVQKNVMDAVLRLCFAGLVERRCRLARDPRWRLAEENLRRWLRGNLSMKAQ